MKTSPHLHLTFLPAVFAVVLAGCSSEPRVSLNTPPAPATVAVAPAPMAAPTAPTTAMGAAGALSATDRDFANTAAVSGLAEVAASQLALTHASDPQVISFAQMMIQQHTAANNELTAIMRARGLPVPTELPRPQVDEMSALAMRSGPDFDALYIRRAGVLDHQGAIATFQRQMPQLADPDLRSWAAKTLPVMQQHLAMAQDIAGRIAG